MSKISDVTLNPWNIRYNKYNHWRGQMGEHKGFVVFASQMFAYRAFIILMESYHKLGFTTVCQIIRRFAPPTENDTDAYIGFVCSRNGWNKNLLVSDFNDLYMLARAMAEFETKVYIDRELFFEVLLSHLNYKL